MLIAAEILFYLFFILKQFYIFPSGNVGPADLALIAAAGLLLLHAVGKWRCESGRADGSSDATGVRQVKAPVRGTLPELCRAAWQRIRENGDVPLLIFFAFVVIVNMAHALTDDRTHALGYAKFTAFWGFNVAAISAFAYLAEEAWKAANADARHAAPGAPRFFTRLNLITKLNLGIQLAIYFSGRGRLLTESWGATRYVGTFNDPNQMAFFVFLMLLFGFLYMARFGDRSYPVFFALGLFLIIVTKSTGMMLGMFVFSGAVAVHLMVTAYRRGLLPSWAWAALIVFFVVLGGVSICLFWPGADFNVQEVDYNTITRIQEKVWKLTHGGLIPMLEDRELDKLYYYPQYMLIGAGEVWQDRFLLTREMNEIHSSFFSILFCYGAVPTCCLLYWLFGKLRKNTPLMLCACIALLSESFLLVNYRQPMFWMVLVYGAATYHDLL